MRSGSTSLKNYLCSNFNLAEHFFEPNKNRVKGYENYPSSTACVIPEDTISETVKDRSYLIREHLLPIEEHLNALLSIPKPERKAIVLKRDWLDSFKSQSNRQGVCPYGTRGINAESCKQSFKKYREDLETYFPENIGLLHIEFNDLINNQSDTLIRILNYYNLDYAGKPLKIGWNK